MEEKKGARKRLPSRGCPFEAKNRYVLLLASFPFLSRPFLVLSREQAQQMSTHLRFLACWENPKPLCVLSLNIPSGKRHLLHFAPHYIQRHTFDFAKATREIFETYSSFYTTLRLN